MMSSSWWHSVQTSNNTNYNNASSLWSVELQPRLSLRMLRCSLEVLIVGLSYTHKSSKARKWKLSSPVVFVASCREGLVWVDINWMDNGECLDLIEKVKESSPPATMWSVMLVMIKTVPVVLFKKLGLVLDELWMKRCWWCSDDQRMCRRLNHLPETKVF